MRAVIQRVSSARVTVDKKSCGAIGLGLLVFVGIENSDQQQDVQWLSKKIVGLRVFNDQDGVMNNALLEVGGDLLIVSQFTLHANTKKGNRPSYMRAAPPEIALKIYDAFLSALSQLTKKPVQAGIFGADMKVSLTNDGPVTIIIDTKNKE